MSVTRRMGKGVVVYTMEYYSALKKNKIMPFASTRIELEIITSEVSQKNKYYMTSLICRI